MPSATGTATQTRSAGQRGRRGRGRGGNRRAPQDAGKGTVAQRAPSEEAASPVKVADNSDKSAEAVDQVDDAVVCWICAEQVKYWSVSECNHRTCHVCALRLRALYKKLECTFCKEPQLSVIFTTSPDAPWASYTPDLIPFRDPKLSISFETQEMMEETLILLRFNCPDPSCDYVGNGWSDLRLHVRAVHGKLMCDLCIRHKKIFSHEHALYAPNQLPIHVPSIYRAHGSSRKDKEQIEGGVHPLCEFCRECYFSDDELYAHMRERHEECFVCKRNEVTDQYFRNYDALEQHFMHAHHPCTQPQCLARKFVVFGSALDLKAHMVEDHGAEMSSRDKRDAMRIQADFEYEEVAGSRRGRRGGGGRERDREPPPAPLPPSPSRLNAAGARRREAFSGNLTGHANAASNNVTPNISRPPSPPRNDGEPTTVERNAGLASRISSLAPNSTAAVTAIQAAIRSYRVSESAARDLILTVWNILDHNLDGTASIINSLVDLMDEEEKKKDLLSAWNGFKIEQRSQFPELVPTAIGTDWAGVTSGRVLNAKHLTVSRSSSQSSRQVWDRVARAAASSSTSSSAFPPPRPPERFPPLQSASPSTTPFRQPQRTTPWASSSSAAPPPVRVPMSVPGPGASSKPAAPVLSKSAFPELPTFTSTRAPKGAVSGNQSLRRILGDSTPATSAWGSGKTAANGMNGGTPPSTAEEPEEEEVGSREQTPGKKKGKGKQKQTLFTFGSFPT
ncbi:hypothetical protein BKA93DRAFT_447316 [Sparassis latifolia]